MGPNSRTIKASYTYMSTSTSLCTLELSKTQVIALDDAWFRNIQTSIISKYAERLGWNIVCGESPESWNRAQELP